ncbi:MAG: ribosome biogenesis GTPase Der [Spirochaetes bacterium]|nr:ribosome biogenesis GTPase Der [Spirochaetota bacterium]
MKDSKDLSSVNYPVVVIAGRPNVGKSTLFNRILGKRKSITDPTPGVTRDAVAELYNPGRITIKLMDTGGVNTSGVGIEKTVSERSLNHVKDADLVLFLLDAKEILPEDEIFIKKIRKYADKIILVINKVDTPEKENTIWNYYSFGFDKVVPVSSAHGYNIDLLEEEIEKALLARNYQPDSPEGEKENEEGGESEGQEEDCESEEGIGRRENVIRLAIMGKPNTGKSTLSNKLTETEQSIVSDMPGTTRDIVEGEFLFGKTKFKIMDTAGIRRKNRVTENVEYYSVNRAIKAIDDCDLVLMLIDAEEGLSDQDKKIANQVVKKGKGIIIVLNKWDKVKHLPNIITAMQDRIRFLFPILDFAPIVPLSALNDAKFDDLLKMAIKVNKQLETRISTPGINKALKEWTEDYPPPSIGGIIKFKVRYITQTGIKPCRFLIFVNRLKGFPASYISYIKNKIRKKFGLGSIPFEINIKETEKVWKEN